MRMRLCEPRSTSCAPRSAACLPGSMAMDALTALQAIYLDPNETSVNRVKAAASAIGFERPKLAATGLVVIDFRERVRQARLKATMKTIEHMPDDEHIPEPV